MKDKGSIVLLLFASVGMFVLIFDAGTAVSGATEGIELCLRTVIPSLYPFAILSILLVGLLQYCQMPWLYPLGRWLHLPKNAEKLLLIGLLGGYPVGAQCIRHACDAGALSKQDAQRMLCFCNNAGPAFIFGIGMHLFGYSGICWLAWLIHILSALLVGAVTPAWKKEDDAFLHIQSVPLIDAVQRATRVMGIICSWVVLFRIILAFLDRWILWLFPTQVSILISGSLELTNGCAQLAQIESLGVRFVFFVTMLGLGGLCVGLQTQAVLSGSGLSLRPYFLGKTAQSALSCLLSIVAVGLYPGGQTHINWIWIVIPIIICTAYYISFNVSKIRIAFPWKMMYTEGKSTGGSTYEAVPPKSRSRLRVLRLRRL